MSENGQMAANAVTIMTGKGAVQTVSRYRSEMAARQSMLDSKTLDSSSSNVKDKNSKLEEKEGEENE